MRRHVVIAFERLLVWDFPPTPSTAACPGSTIGRMSSKKLVWLGFFVGSTIGGIIPTLWGDDMISVSAIVLSTLGGVAGIWAGIRVSQSL